MKNVLAFIMAGGRGKRLMPLTQDRAKPAVPFGGIYRLIDLTLSNCINSQLYKIIVTQQLESIGLQLQWPVRELSGDDLDLRHGHQGFPL